ncbi:uncharacterized protein LOC141851720 [Brevipalpus obovatus]|uniref:uncharacterized protein LOC141851720 n=1 Tax=Brevipalpus obovatus TaxID=246614 RepID=UPI003D9E6D69
MPITRSRQSSEQQQVPESVAGDVAVDKETAVKELKAAATPVVETTKQAKDEPANGCPRVASVEGEKPVNDEKVESGTKNGTEPKVADESDAVTGDKEIAASQAEAVEDGQNGTDAGIAEAAAANGSLSRSAVTDDKTSEVKEHVNEVQEAEAKVPSGDVCAKRKTDEADVCGEADSTCKKNKVEGEAVDPVVA